MDGSLLIAFLIFILVLLLGFLMFYYSNLYSKKKNISERIRKETAPDTYESLSQEQKWKGIIQKTVSGFGETVSPKNEADVSRSQSKLVTAGYYGENSLTIFLGSKVIAAIIFSAICVILKFSFLKTMPTQQFLVFVILFTAAGFYIPDLYIYRRTKARKRTIFEGFPDALDLMVVCVEAGMGLDAAIKRVGDEMSRKCKELGAEFKMLSLELRAGKPRAEALRNLAARTDLEDVTSLVTLLIQTDKFGTRVGQALRVHSDAMRTKRYQRAEEIAAKLPVKIVFPLIFFIFPALFVSILGPAIIRIYRVLILR
ncbi:MAG TPA: type II secretion system F family protein [Candidatus Sulfobium mesophilum]|nr:type II secretion system F family protein [Candidatus Sulfobium mesophilum]